MTAPAPSASSRRRVLGPDGPRHPDIARDAALPRIPSRYQHVEAARERHGDLVDRFGPFLMHGDPPADDLVAAFSAMPPGRGRKLLAQALEHGIDSVRRPPRVLEAFFREVEHVPVWVDWPQLKRGGEVVLRAGPVALLVLETYALPLSYASASGNKPLAFSGRLVERAYRRLSETVRFVYETCRPDGLRRGASGFDISIRVRLMHAQVRRLLLRSGRWETAEWGMPINQADMAATNILFSVLLIQGMRKLGARLSDAEVEDVIALWRYVGTLMGVDHRLCVTSMAEGQRIGDVVLATLEQPDADSRALVEALMEVPYRAATTPREHAMARRYVPLSYALSRWLIGDDLADQLAYPRSRWSVVVPPMRAGLSAWSILRRALPDSRTRASQASMRFWEELLQEGMAAIPTAFRLPDRLDRLPRGGRNDTQ